MSRRYLRPGALAGHLLVLIAALVCLRLGWWQWNVAHQTRGTIQNLGYALLWPVFGGAFIFMWLRFLYLEERRVQPIDFRAPGADPGVDGAGEPTASGGGAELLVTEPAEHAEPGTDRPEVVAGDAPLGGPGPDDQVVDTGPGVVDPSPAGTDPVDGEPPGGSTPDDAEPRLRRPRRGPLPSTAVTLAVATVGDDDDDDPELTAYNEALARLAEQDRRRAR